MASDPAFLFYPGDWLGGTTTFNRQYKGAYIDLLIAQFNNVALTMEDIKEILGQDFYMWDAKLKFKFEVEANGLFFNRKLRDEIIKRKNFTQSRRDNLSGKEHIVEEVKAVAPKKAPVVKEEKIFKYMENDTFKASFAHYLEMRIKIRKPATERAKEMALNEVHRYPLAVAIKMLDQSVMNSWQGIFPLRDNNSTSPPLELRNKPDKSCNNCQGSGFVYAPGSGKNAHCYCTKIK